MTQSQLVKRIEQIEHDLQRLKHEVARNQPSDKKPSADKLYGLFRNDPYFEKAVAAGAAYRRSLRPRTRSTRSKKK